MTRTMSEQHKLLQQVKHGYGFLVPAEGMATFSAGAAGLRSMGFPCSSTSLPCSSSLSGAGPPVFGRDTAAVLGGAPEAAPTEEDRICTPGMLSAMQADKNSEVADASGDREREH